MTKSRDDDVLLSSSSDTGGKTVAREKKTYKCPRCDNRITVLVSTVHPPTCSKHTGGGTVMKLVKASK